VMGPRLVVKYRDGRDRHASFSSGPAKRNSVLHPSAPGSFAHSHTLWPSHSNTVHTYRTVGKREEEEKKGKKKRAHLGLLRKYKNLEERAGCSFASF